MLRVLVVRSSRALYKFRYIIVNDSTILNVELLILTEIVAAPDHHALAKASVLSSENAAVAQPDWLHRPCPTLVHNTESQLLYMRLTTRTRVITDIASYGTDLPPILVTRNRLTSAGVRPSLRTCTRMSHPSNWYCTNLTDLVEYDVVDQ